MEQQISKQLHRAEPVETNEEMERTARQNKSDIYSVTDVLRRFLKPTWFSTGHQTGPAPAREAAE